METDLNKAGSSLWAVFALQESEMQCKFFGTAIRAKTLHFRGFLSTNSHYSYSASCPCHQCYGKTQCHCTWQLLCQRKGQLLIRKHSSRLRHVSLKKKSLKLPPSQTATRNASQVDGPLCMSSALMDQAEDPLGYYSIWERNKQHHQHHHRK